MSGPVLGTPIIPVNCPRAIPRAYVQNLIVQWADQVVEQCGQNLILRETLFGGYKVHISFHSWFWNWSSKTARIDNLFETFYVLAPGGSTPITPGNYGLTWTTGGSDFQSDILINLAGYTDMTTTNPTAPPPPTYYGTIKPNTWPNCHTERRP